MASRIHNAALLVGALAVFAAGVFATSPAWARRITLNDTGMTQCIDHQGDWSADCVKSRQDAANGRDVKERDPTDGIAGFSFRKVCRSGQMSGEGSCPADPVVGNGPDDWGCTYDNVTQLTWETKTDDGGAHDGGRLFTNKGKKARNEPGDAAWLVEATNTENLCGSSSWRLPDVLELQSIVDYGQGIPHTDGPWIDQTFFPNTVGRTWSRVDWASDTKWAWYVWFSFGDVYVRQRLDGLTTRLVHRATQSFQQRAPVAGSRFIPSPDGTEVKDTLTGLVWRRCAEGMVWQQDTQTCEGTASEFEWKDALDYAAANKMGGWRIPNIKELISIVDQTRTGPAIDLSAFPNSPNASFLSSTPLDHAGDVYAQILSFGNGSVSQEDTFRFNEWKLRLVRGGRE